MGEGPNKLNRFQVSIDASLTISQGHKTITGSADSTGQNRQNHA